MEAAKHSMYLLYAGRGLCLLDCVDDAAVAARCLHHQTFAFEQEIGSDLMLEIIGYEFSGVLRRGDLLREATEAIHDTNFLCCVSKWLFKPALRNFPGGESMIWSDRRLPGHHEQQVGIQDGLPIQRAVLPAIGIDSRAETVFPSDEERQLVLELPLCSCQEAHHPAEMIVMTMAKH